MRCLRRNKVRFYYALFDHREDAEDEYGNLTGGQMVYHGNPVFCKANISPAKNADVVQLFGTDVNYDKVIVMDRPDIPIDENSVLWVDRLPVLDADGKTETPFDYIIREIARSLNSVTIAIAKVDVSA